MMESCLNSKMERTGSVEVEDLKKDLLADFSAIPSTSSQDLSVLEKEHLRVYLRIRPFTASEIDNGESQECVTVEPPDTVLLTGPRISMSLRLSDKSVSQTGQRFQFSKVYGPEATQRDIFDGTVGCLVRDVLEGENSLVFTYGVTNAGKTFTFLGPDSDSGILPRSLKMIFKSIDGRVYTKMNIKPHRCRDFTRLTEDQLNEEIVTKRNMMRLCKESDSQKSMSSLLSSCRTTLLEGSTMSSTDGLADEDSIRLDVDDHTKFCVWISFCEIYNENIHDLLEPMSSCAQKRNTLRLAQDIKGNSFVKDLKWVQVNDAEEAYKILKLGKKNQSFSCTKLNNLSSRSHCIFSVRIIRVEDVGVPRVHTISELSLCDLAGSERCAKTHNKGDRLKEAGNINASLLILGKCINALRHNQQSKLQQHVPFRESKLTHYLQGFFCGRGKACMIVNISQCASMFDETLNVLRFSAVAQKVVVLNTKPLPIVPKKSVREVSFIINSADQRSLWAKRKSSLVGWEMTLEDVQENEDDGDTADESVNESMEDTIQDEDEETEIDALAAYEAQLEEMKEKLREAKRDNLSLESRIREEVAKEYMELFSKMEKDYNERLLKEKEIIEERAEKRMEIWKTLVQKSDGEESQLDNGVSLDSLIDYVQNDLEKIKRDAEAAQNCLVALPDSDDAVGNLEKRLAQLTEELRRTQEQLTLKTNEKEELCCEAQKTSDKLGETKRDLESKAQKFQELMEICQEKDDAISKLQSAMDEQCEIIAKDRSLIASIKEEMVQMRRNCTCLSAVCEGAQKAGRKRLGDFVLDAQPPPKKETCDEDHFVTPAEIDKLQAECNRKGDELVRLREKYEALQVQMEALKADLKATVELKDKKLEELDLARLSLEIRADRLARDLEEQTRSHGETKASLDVERSERARLVEQMSEQQREAENMAQKISTLELDLWEQKRTLDGLPEELKAAKALLVERNNDAWQKSKAIESLTQEAECLRTELQKVEGRPTGARCGHFHDTMDALQQECQKLVKESSEKSQRISNLEQDLLGLQEQVGEKDELSRRLDEVEELRERSESAAAEAKRSCSQLEVEAEKLQGRVANLERQLEAAGEEASRVMGLEQQLTEKEALLAAVHASLNETQQKLEDAEASSLQEARRKEAERRRELLKVAEEAIAEKDAELARRAQEISRLKEEAGVGSAELANLRAELERRDEDSTDAKLKLADSKKQIQQVLKEVESMREGEKSLRRKVAELEKAKTQLVANLSSKGQTIQQLKSEQASSAKSDENLQLYQKACSDLQAKDQIIETMRTVLKEQEETQKEQDGVIETQLDDIRSLNEELQKWKDKTTDHKKECGDAGNVEECQLSPCKAVKQEMDKVGERLKLSEEKYQADRKKWLEDKLVLISHAKQAEERRNQEMKKFAEDRERYVKVQAELDTLSKQLAEKEEDLLKWRKERDALVSALETRMKELAASYAEKDKQIQQLTKQCTSLPQEVTDGNIKELQDLLSKKDCEIAMLKRQLAGTSDIVKKTRRASDKCTESQSLTGIMERSETNEEAPFKNCLGGTYTLKQANSSAGDHEEEVVVLDSSEISSEGGKVSRFPKPELEIQFTSLQPNKVNVKRQGGDSVTYKITRPARKRKSNEMTVDKSNALSGCWKSKIKLMGTRNAFVQDPVASENRKNSLRSCRLSPACEKKSQATYSPAPHMRHEEPHPKTKKDGTLQKIGDFLQSSPTLLGSKAKKIMELVHSKSPEPEGRTAAGLRPKRSKRRLYTTDISSPLDIPSHPIIGLDQDDKDTDHIIIKRRLRTRTGKK